MRIAQPTPRPATTATPSDPQSSGEPPKASGAAPASDSPPGLAPQGGPPSPKAQARPHALAAPHGAGKRPVAQAFAAIAPGLCLGAWAEARSLPTLTRAGITHIVNVADGCDNRFAQHFTYLKIPCRDVSHEALAPYFPEVARFVGAAQAAGGRVLVHCQFGISRSVAFVVATLMSNAGMSLAAALTKVQAVRPEAEPNPGFLQQLRELEATLAGAPVTAPAVDAAAWGQAVQVLCSVYAVNHLHQADLLAQRQAALNILAARPASTRIDLLLTVWRDVCENYATLSVRDARAHAAFAGLWHQAIAQQLVGHAPSVAALAALAQQEAWADLRLDVPYADAHLAQLERLLSR